VALIGEGGGYRTGAPKVEIGQIPRYCGGFSPRMGDSVQRSRRNLAR